MESNKLSVHYKELLKCVCFQATLCDSGIDMNDIDMNVLNADALENIRVM